MTDDNVIEFPAPPLTSADLTGTLDVFSEGKKVKAIYRDGKKMKVKRSQDVRRPRPRQVDIDFKLTDDGVIMIMEDVRLTVSPEAALVLADVLIDLGKTALELDAMTTSSEE